jgi:peroxiredoxin
MLRRVFTGIAVGFVLTAVCLVLPPRMPATMATGEARKTAPDFALTDTKGAVVTLSHYRGKVVLLDFWATWCHGCKTEIPWFMEFDDKYRAKGLAVIGVAMDGEGWKVVKPFVEEKKMNYAVVAGNDDVAKQYGVEAMPVTLLIDREGKIAASHAGVVDKDAWESKIRTLLKEGVENGVK